MSFEAILNKYRQKSFSERDKGTRFERLMQGYLQTDPTYADKLEKVWLWEEFPGRESLGGNDTGIDLVAMTTTGEYWAIQCKCYDEANPIDKGSVDSFLATSSRKFTNETANKIAFSNRLWISTNNNWSSNAEEAIKDQKPPVNRLNLSDLVQSPVNWEAIESGKSGKKALSAEPRSPKKHQ